MTHTQNREEKTQTITMASEIGLCRCGHAREDHKPETKEKPDGSTFDYRGGCKYHTEVYDVSDALLAVVPCRCKLYDDIANYEPEEDVD